MARKDELTPALFDEAGDVSVAAGSVELADGDFRYAGVMRDNYLLYAKSVAHGRALPDVRDGLKPVQRRVLLSMKTNGLTSTANHSKSSGVVGDVMKYWHPHGDASIYDSLVYMAQDFRMRAPLVDGQGNFGSVDGDGAAAPRYTEARMTPLAEALVVDLPAGAQAADIIGDDLGMNYSEELPEPNVFPARFPNILVNGVLTGIAVGMATKILPHNPAEVLDLCVWRLANPDAPVAKLADRLSPDLPTGALIVDDEGLRESYLTGRGKVTALAKAHIEPHEGNREKVVITEIPWGVGKGDLLVKIKGLYEDKKLDELSEANDYSDEDVRIELVLKRGSNAGAVLQRLYKLLSKDMRVTYGVNMLCVVGGKIRTLNLAEIIDHFLEFRRVVVIRIAQRRMRQIEQRLHKLDALMKAIDAIDAVVKTIRASKNRADAKPKLEKLLDIDEQQSQWIVEMPLGNLTSLETTELREEAKELRAELKHLTKFVKTPAMVAERMTEEFKELRKQTATPRRTALVSAGSLGGDVSAFQQPAEDCILLMSRNGMAVCGQGTMQRGAGLALAAGDILVTAEAARTDEERIVFTASGKAYRLRLAELPLENKRSKGEPLAKIIGIESTDPVVAVHRLADKPQGTALFAYRSGTVKRTRWEDLASAHASGIVAAKPNPGDELIAVADCPDTSEVLLIGSHGKAIRFPATDMRPMGRDANGVRGIKLPDDAQIRGVLVIPAGSDHDVVVTTTARTAKRITLDDIPSQKRDGGGVDFTRSDKTGEPALAILAAPKGQIWVQSADGKLKAHPAAKVTVVKRANSSKIWAPAESAVALLSIADA